MGGAAQRFRIAEQLQSAGLGAGRIVLEPEGRNTGPALAAGALLALSLDPDALILSAHADHAIPDTGAFLATLDRGLRAADAGHVVLFGMRPSHPATGYGYIHPAEPLAIDPSVRRIERFVEKPDEKRARAFIEDGYLWNSGNFVFRADVMLDELARFEPEIAAAAVSAPAAPCPC